MSGLFVIEVTDTKTGDRLGTVTPEQLRSWMGASRLRFVPELVAAYNAAGHGQTVEQVIAPTNR